VEKNQKTQAQIDSDILRCRADILRARRVVAAVPKQESSDSPASDTKNRVKPTEKGPAQAEQNSQTQTKTEQEAKAVAEKARQEARAAREKAEHEAKARAEAEEKINAEQDLKTAAQKAQQEARAAREKAQQEAGSAREKAQQEAKARVEAEQKAKSESEARAKAEQEAKAAAEKTQQEVAARVEAEQKAKLESEARIKAEQEAKAAAEKAQQEVAARAGAKVEAACVASEANSGQEADKQIPRFNLAQQILSEQRRVASMRRGRPTEPGGSTEARPATGTIGQIIREAKRKAGDVSETAETVLQLSCGVHGVIKGQDNLDPAQQQVISDIVTLDIARLCVDEDRRRDAR